MTEKTYSPDSYKRAAQFKQEYLENIEKIDQERTVCGYPYGGQYIDLHVHTEASYRDAVTKIDEIISISRDLGRPAFAITDHGHQMRLFHGLRARTKDEKAVLKVILKEQGKSDKVIEKILDCFGPTDSVRYPQSRKLWNAAYKNAEAFYETARRAIQFVPGVELYFQPEKDGSDPKSYHLILWAKDWDGQKALFKLEGLAQLNKDKYGAPRTTWADMERILGDRGEGHGHVIGASACVSGYIPSLLLRPYAARMRIAELDYDYRMNPAPYDPQDLKTAEDSLAECNERYVNAKEAEQQLRAYERNNYEKKIETLKARLEKTRQKIEEAKEKYERYNTDYNQKPTDAKKGRLEKLLSSISGMQTDLEIIQEKIETIAEEQSMASKVLAQAADIRDYLITAKNGVEAARNRLAEINKAMRPYFKYSKQREEEEAKIIPESQAYQEAKEAALHYAAIFGDGNFYIELQHHGFDNEDYVFPLLMKLVQETGIPPIVSNDVHFARREDFHKRCLVATMRFPNMRVEETESRKEWEELYIKTDAEMESLISGNESDKNFWKWGMKNTAIVAASCKVYHKYEMHLPEFDANAAGFNTAKEYLESYCRKRIPEKYPLNTMNPEVRADLLSKIEERMRYELDMIEKMGYSSYLAIVQDFIFYGRKIGGNNAIGPGRGSAAGSIVCYLSDITDIDPLKYDLYFERFLNPERVSMPDIDTDLAPSIRNDVIKYVSQKYAYQEEYSEPELKGTVCNIVTESGLTAKNAIRSVARVCGVDLSVADELAKMVPMKPGITIQKAMKENPALTAAYNSDPLKKKVLDDAMLVEGIPSQTGVHAAGVIIADKPISEYAPLLWNDEKQCWVIECDMIQCEKTLGLLKMDFLGLINLDIIDMTVDLIKRKKPSFDDTVLKNVDDVKVIREVYGKGNTDGVFQFEGDGITQFLKRLAPKSINDIILMNAAYRPGPIDNIPAIIDTKQGRKKATYLVPDMQDILSMTYGYPVYQEQIMQLFQMVGYSLGKADVIRRAMSKKHLDEIEAEKDVFCKGLMAKGASEEDTETFWNQLLAFASYAFNKSHAAAYSIVSFETAWLKHYYPVEFMSALMSNNTPAKNEEYLADCKRNQIKVYGPNINASEADFIPAGKEKAIRYGLKNISNVGAAAQILCDLREGRNGYPSLGPIRDFRDFIIRCACFGVSREAADALIKTGALDCLFQGYENRKTYSQSFAAAATSCRKAVAKIKNAEGITGDTDIYHKLLVSWKMEPLTLEAEFNETEKLGYEKELLKMYVSGSPFEKYKDVFQSLNNRDTTIGAILDGTTVSRKEIDIAGIIMNARHVDSKKGKMAFFTLEDDSGSIPCVCFSEKYGNMLDAKERIVDGTLASLTGKISKNKNGDIQFSVFSVRKIENQSLQ